MMLNPYSGDAYLTYSTWSLNPIENEAVVYSALRKLNSNPAFDGEFELIDCRDRLDQFKTRKGLWKWGVYDSILKQHRKRDLKFIDKNDDNLDFDDEKDCDPNFEEYFREYKIFEDIPSGRRDKFKSTFFASNEEDKEIESKYHLSRCIRVFPNDQNTSGFFIALIRRNSIHKLSNITNEENMISNIYDKITPIQKPLNKLIRWDPNDPDIEYIKTYYGISEDFPFDQIFTYSDTMAKLMLINKGLSDVLYADQNKQLNLIAAGAETFIKNTSK